MTGEEYQAAKAEGRSHGCLPWRWDKAPVSHVPQVDVVRRLATNPRSRVLSTFHTQMWREKSCLFALISGHDSRDQQLGCSIQQETRRKVGSVCFGGLL